MEEQENLGGIGVALGQSQKVEVVVTDVEVLAEKSALCCFDYGRCGRFGRGHIR